MTKPKLHLVKSNLNQRAVIEIYGDSENGGIVLIDGIVPIAIARAIASLVDEYNRSH